MKSTRLSTRIVIATLVLCVLSSAPVFTTTGPKSEPNVETNFVLNQFRTKSFAECLAAMDKLRPQAVTTEEKVILKQAGFDVVNAKNTINDPAVLAKLYDETREVLQFHHRAGIVEYIYFKHDEPIVETKAGAFIAFANRLWELGQDKDGRSGIIAHELSHEYFALQFFEAYQSHDCAKMRVIELECDALATVTLIALKMNPDRYAYALRRIVHNSKESEKLNDGNNGMPALEARLQVISEIKKQFSK